MIKANQSENIISVSVSGTEVDNSVLISYENNISNSISGNITEENLVDIGNLFVEGNGINIDARTISVDSTVVALKTDLGDFLTSEDISGKADSATTLAGYGILDGITYEIIEEDEEEEE